MQTLQAWCRAVLRALDAATWAFAVEQHGRLNFIGAVLGAVKSVGGALLGGVLGKGAARAVVPAAGRAIGGGIIPTIAAGAAGTMLGSALSSGPGGGRKRRRRSGLSMSQLNRLMLVSAMTKGQPQAVKIIAANKILGGS